MNRLRDAWLVLIGRRFALDGITARGITGALAQDDQWRDEGVPVFDLPAYPSTYALGRLTGTITAPRGLLVDDFPPGITLKEI